MRARCQLHGCKAPAYHELLPICTMHVFAMLFGTVGVNAPQFWQQGTSVPLPGVSLPRRAVADYYKLLGVGRKATADEIKTAYRKKAFRYHPDRKSGQKDNGEKMRLLNEAYAVLSDPRKRLAYDLAAAVGAA